jgi:hypothetical protein
MPTTFLCVLLADNGVIKKKLIREGKSEEAVLDGLSVWEWPSGEWRIRREDGEYDEMQDEHFYMSPAEQRKEEARAEKWRRNNPKNRR